MKKCGREKMRERMTEDSVIVGVMSAPTHFVSRRAARGMLHGGFGTNVVHLATEIQHHTFKLNAERTDEQTNEREHDCDQL